jgi:hypothetical protein
MRLLVVSSAGACNYGDDATLLSTLQRLQRVRPGCIPTVVTDGPHPPPLGRLGLWGGTLAELCQSLDPQAIRNACRTWPGVAEKITELAAIGHDPSCKRFDLQSFGSVVFCGSRWTHHSLYLPARRALVAAAARACTIPYIIAGQDLGPLAQDLQPMLAFFADGARDFGPADLLGDEGSAWSPGGTGPSADAWLEQALAVIPSSSVRRLTA